MIKEKVSIFSFLLYILQVWSHLEMIDWFVSWLQLIFPFLELDIKYFDLGLLSRDATDDRVTVESAEATLKLPTTTFFIVALPLPPST